MKACCSGCGCPACRAPPASRSLAGLSDKRHHAGSHRLAVHMHRAGTALRQPASVVRPVQPEVVAQRIEQRHLRVIESTVTCLPLTVSCFLGMAKTSRFLERAAFGVTAVPPYRAFAMAPWTRAGRAFREPFQNRLRRNPFAPRDDLRDEMAAARLDADCVRAFCSRCDAANLRHVLIKLGIDEA